MMLSVLLTGILIFVCFLLQTCVFPAVLPFSVSPDLFIILTSAYGFMRGEKTGLAAGFVCGLLYDIAFGDVVGFHALLYMYIGFINGKFARVYYPEDIKLPLALITISNLTYCLICYVMNFLIRGRLQFGFYMSKVILPEMIGTLVVALLFYPLLLKINEGLKKWERRSEQRFG